MKLKSLNKYLSLFLFVFLVTFAKAEEEIDIWNKKTNNNSKIKSPSVFVDQKTKSPLNTEAFNENKVDQNIVVEESQQESKKDIKISGIYDPAENNFNLNMWSKSNAEDIRASLRRINKINLSNTSKKLFENTLLSFSYPPKGMDEKEFTDYKLNWMINNKRSDLIEKFLKQNDTFHNKKKAVQYLVDENIAKANIKESCNKINFLDKSIKDPYLEKYKIYCLIFNNKKNEAQLLYDILKEQDQSDNFFDDKINFLLNIKDITGKKIKDDNLLNFYLSSVTIENFNYEPTNKTKKIIWEYLNAANLIKLDDITDKEKIKNLEIAANTNQLEKEKIFDIYKKIPFDLNSLINASDTYQALDEIDSRALIYQKFLLSDSPKKKVELLFLLKDLFKKDNLTNIYSEFLSDQLQTIDKKDIPESYKEVVEKNIKIKDESELGKIKYNDKILHKSKLVKYFTENQNKKKIQKDFDRIYKKIKKNKKYFYSARDMALINTFEKDGFKIPKDLNYQDMVKKYQVPSNLLQLSKNNEPAFLTLKIVEIIGEDEPQQLDSETIYFITYLLNQTNLKKLRNEVLISALPQRS